jgi:hypothetical protein
VFNFLTEILSRKFAFQDKAQALQCFQNLRHVFMNWNYKGWESEEFRETEKELRKMLDEAETHEESV